jgi:hypothetical protein
VKLFQKYKLMEFVDVFLMNGTFPLIRIWKHLVYDTIRKYELSEWTQRLNDDKALNVIGSKLIISVQNLSRMFDK